MDKATAQTFVERLEEHRAQEAVIWDEMRSRSDYETHEDTVIESIIQQRKQARLLLEESHGQLESFDWVDDGDGNFVPPNQGTDND